MITVIPSQIQSPSMTADWEEKLSLIEHGKYEPDHFMEEIMELVNHLISMKRISGISRTDRKNYGNSCSGTVLADGNDCLDFGLFAVY